MKETEKVACIWKEVCGCECEGCEHYTPEEDDIDEIIETERINFRREYTEYLLERRSNYDKKRI